MLNEYIHVQVKIITRITPLERDNSRKSLVQTPTHCRSSPSAVLSHSPRVSGLWSAGNLFRDTVKCGGDGRFSETWLRPRVISAPIFSKLHSYFTPCGPQSIVLGAIKPVKVNRGQSQRRGLWLSMWSM